MINYFIYKTKRKNIFQNILLLKIILQFLFHIKIGIELVIKFINTIKIVTRVWYLSKTQMKKEREKKRELKERKREKEYSIKSIFLFSYYILYI